MGDFGPNSGTLRASLPGRLLAGGLSGVRVSENIDKASQKIGASVIDKYSEGGTNRYQEDFAAASINKGGLSPSIISPFYRKRRLGLG